MVAQSPYSVFPILNCGPDWLTCTSKRRGVSNELEDWAMDQLHKAKAGDGQVSPAIRLGYSGLSTSGLFVGRRPADVCVQLTGPSCAPLATQAIKLASNVSRIDLQVTVWTEGEQPHLAAWTYKQLIARDQGVGRPRRLTLISGHPDGETLNIGKRSSDAYLRLYDKTAEASLGVPRLLWRYEVELKRKRARQVALQLAEQECRPQSVCTLVHVAYTKRGVEPSFSTSGNRNAFETPRANVTRDLLTWYRNSLSITIKTSIAKYGEPAVLDALGLSRLLQRGPNNGDLRTRADALSTCDDDEPTQPNLSERVLLH